MATSHADDRAVQRQLALIFLAGLAVSITMLTRSQVSDDSLHLLSRGWLLAEHGVLSPIGNAAAEDAGGYVPGSVSAIVTGLPLMVWMDYRAPIVLLLLFHLCAWYLLDTVVREELGNRARVVLAVLYWLNPWQIYQASWLDNSNFVFLAGAVHLWACYKQRSAASFGASVLLAAAIGLALQMHLSAFILLFSATLLWWRGYWKPHRGGLTVGALIALLPFIPFVVEAWQHPEIVPGGGEESPGSNLLKIWPVLKGFAYWVRYSSLYVSRAMMSFDFKPALGVTTGKTITAGFAVFAYLVAGLTVCLAATANLWWLRALRGSSPAGHAIPAGSAFLSGYAAWTLLSCLLANAVSPEVTMWWHDFIALHAALIPVVLWVVSMQRRCGARAVRQGVAAYAVAAFILCAGMSIGSAHFRKGGDNPVVFPEPEYHPMITDLKLDQCCTPDAAAWKAKQRYFYDKYLHEYAAAAEASGT